MYHISADRLKELENEYENEIGGCWGNATKEEEEHIDRCDICMEAFLCGTSAEAIIIEHEQARIRNEAAKNKTKAN